MGKRRSDSVLFNLPEAQQAQLAEWILSGVPYHRCKELLEKEFTVVCKSLSAFSPFYEEVCVPILHARRARAAGTAREVKEEAQRTPGHFSEAAVDLLEQKSFELAMSPGADPKAVKAIFSLVLKARDQKLDAERLKLDLEKFQFDAAEAAMEHAAAIKLISADGQLGSEEKIARVRRVLFGVT